MAANHVGTVSVLNIENRGQQNMPGTVECRYFRMPVECFCTSGMDHGE